MKYKILLMLICMSLIVLTNSVSAVWDWDNVQDYDERTNTYTISNAFGLPELLGGGEIAKLTLITPTHNRLFDRGDGVMQKVAEFTIENYYNGYPNTFRDMEFFHRSNMRAFQRNFEYKYEVVTGTKQVPDTYEEICNPYLDINGSTNRNCVSVVATYRTADVKEWITLNHLEDLPEGNITIGIFTDVYNGDNVEWIPTFFGERLTEWASWSVGLNDNLLFYIPANVTLSNMGGTGTNGTEDVRFGTHNVSFIFGASIGAGGKIGNGIVFDGTTGRANISNGVAWANLSSNNLQGFTISAWVSYDGDTDELYIIDSFETGKGGGFLLLTTAGKCRFYVGTQASNVFVDSNQSCRGGSGATGYQYHWVGVWNGSTIYQYVNGTLQNDTALLSAWTNSTARFGISGDTGSVGGELPGVVDELAMWNRTLTTSEISDLWNDGAGITYRNFDVPPMTILTTLLNPIANHQTINTSLVFESNYSVAYGNVTNATVYVWYANFSLLGTNTSVVSINGTSNSTNLTIGGLTISENYEWNIYACANNNSGTECSFASANRSFDVNSFETVSEYWVNDTTEGAVEYFEINITVVSGFQVSTGRLNYNNTNYDGTLTNPTTDNYTISRNLEIEGIEGEQANQTFFWIINLEGGSQDNSTERNQTVVGLTIDDCTTNTIPILNYTMRAERNQTIMNGNLDNTLIEVDVDIYTKGTSNLILNLSQKFEKKNGIMICVNDLLNGTGYDLYSTTRYQATGFEEEYHHIQKATLNNNTLARNVTLFDLLTTESTEFLITFKDDDFLPVGDALVDITRQYVSDGVFKSVEIPKTDSDGQTVGHFKAGDTVYTIVIKKNGVILETFLNIIPICEDIVAGDCKLNLISSETSQSFDDWERYGGISYSISFNEETRKVTTSFTSLDGTTRTVSVNATKYDRFGNNTVCSDTLDSSTGTLTCTIPQSFGNVTIITEVYSEGNLIGTEIYSIKRDASDIFGVDGLLLFLILMLTLPLMMVTNKIGLIVVSILGLIVAGALTLYEGGSIFGSASAILWFIIAGGILIWKMSRVNRGI